MYTNLSLNIIFGKIFQSGFRYRDRASIVGDILDSINSDPKGKTKTSIMRGANLNLDQVNTYLQLLMIAGLVKPNDPIKSQELARYKLTSKGFRIARDLETWRYLMAFSHRASI